MMQEDAARRQIRQTLPPAPHIDPCADGAELPPFWDNDYNDDWIFEAIVEVYQKIQQLMVEFRYLQQQIKDDNIRIPRYRAAIDEHRRNKPTWNDYYWDLYSGGAQRWYDDLEKWYYRMESLQENLDLSIESLERNNRRIDEVESLVDELFEEYNDLYNMLSPEDQIRADKL